MFKNKCLKPIRIILISKWAFEMRKCVKICRDSN